MKKILILNIRQQNISRRWNPLSMFFIIKKKKQPPNKKHTPHTPKKNHKNPHIFPFPPKTQIQFSVW